MTEEQRIDLSMRVHSVLSNVDDILQAASTADGRDELSMMLKALTSAYWDLGKVLMKISYVQAAE